MKALFAAIIVCALACCGGAEETGGGTGPATVKLYEGGKLVGHWRAFDVVRIDQNKVEFINEPDWRRIIVSGTYPASTRLASSTDRTIPARAPRFFMAAMKAS